jgi:hypothetical protein
VAESTGYLQRVRALLLNVVANALFCVVANATIFFDVVLTICPQGMAKTLSSKNNWAQRASDTRLFYPSFKLAKS